jgi:myxalamid-type polyketide synthase MxaE and MxaD
MQPVAVIGIGCRFPLAAGPRAFWRLLEAGVDAVGASAREGRLAADAGGRPAGLLAAPDLFDAGFFGISPREARAMDPQQRILLEVAWEALEDAGQPPSRLRGSRCGVFVGVMGSEYGQRQAIEAGNLGNLDVYAASGNGYSMLANRVSYHFDLHGPSLAIDTACSSSLVSVLLACRSLEEGACDLALAGGVNLILSTGLTAFYEQAGLAARGGRCRSFDAAADGIVRGEGAGVVVLKPLAAALADGDPIRAVVLGGAINHDGLSNGIMAPSRWAQEAVLREAYRDAGISPAAVGYVEAHGTGTLLGDPIEAKALGTVLAEGGERRDPCAIGSVKSNLGHLEGAAGIVGFIKTVLSLEHREIPPSLHFMAPNPHIAFDDLQLRVQRTLAAWPAGPAVAAVSAFGLGGTNAHVVLREAVPAGEPAPVSAADELRDGPFLLPLSARTKAALGAAREAWRGFLADVADVEAGAAIPLADLAAAAALGRTHHEHRLALSVASREELATLLEREEVPSAASAASAVSAASGSGRPGRRLKLAFVFSGQGPQWPGMGRELLATEPMFRAVLEHADERVQELAGWSLKADLAAGPERSRLGSTEIAQPVLVALQAGLTALWRAWGIVPDAVLGHSLGEVSAAHAAGILDLDDALRIAVHRGRLMQRATGFGKMAALVLPAAEVERELRGYRGRLGVAAVNSSNHTVISGDPEAVEEVLATLTGRGIASRLLPVDYAFHSPQMAVLADELAAALQGLSPRPAEIPFYSTRLGERAAGPELDAAHWAAGLTEPVLFSAALDRAVAAGIRSCLEIGPHPVLARPIAEGLAAAGGVGLVGPAGLALASLRRDEGERKTMLGTLGALYERGHDVAWGRLYDRRRPVTIPGYPWQHESFWYEPTVRPAAARPARGPAAHPLLGDEIHLAELAHLRLWEGCLDREEPAYLVDHRIQGAIVLPGAAYLEMALAAAIAANAGNVTPGEARSEVSPVLEEVYFERALFLSGEPVLVQTVVEDTGSGAGTFRIYSRPATPSESGDRLHARGEIRWGVAVPPPPTDLDRLRALCRRELPLAPYYEGLRQRGFEWGPAFRGLDRLWQGNDQALGHLRLPEPVAAGAGRYRFHPALLDACLHVAGVALATAQGGAEAYMPIRVGSLRVHGVPGSSLWSHATVSGENEEGDGALAADVRIFDERGELIAEVLGLVAEAVGTRAPAAAQPDVREFLHGVDWLPQEMPAGAAGAAPGGAWIVLADRGGVGEALGDLLAARGELCLVVTRLGEPAGRGPLRLAIDPAATAGWERLAGAAAELARPLHRVVHLWGLDATVGERATAAEALDQALVCAQVPRLAGWLGDLPGHPVPHLWIATRGAQPVAGQASPDAVAQATLWGLGRTLAVERPALWGGLVDLDPAATAAASAGSLLAEMTGASGEDQVGFRAGVRHVARLSRDPGAAERRSPVRLRADATYLITGGLGDLGLAVGRHLVEQGARRLLLLGWSGLPSRELWSEVEPGEPAGRRIARLREIEALGASVHVAAVDVADPMALRSFLARFASEQWPPIRGIVHAAGTLAVEEVSKLGPADLRAALRAKVAGSWLLAESFAAADLDFFVLFSSASAVLGSPWLGAYAAANAFLDALAYRLRARGSRAQSLGWGVWENAGMAGRAHAEGMAGPRGIGSLSVSQGLDLLRLLMAGDAVQVNVLPVDWPQWARLHPEAAASPFLARLVAPRENPPVPAGSPASPGSGAPVAGEILAAGAEQRTALLQAYLQFHAAAVLGSGATLPEIHRSLSSLGFDSLMAVEMKNRIERELGANLPVVRLLDGTTLEQLATQVAERLPGTGSVPTKTAIDDLALAVRQSPEELLLSLDQLSADQLDGLLAELASMENA